MKANYHNVKKGSKIIFKGSSPHWFTDRIENAKKFTVGNVYTVKGVSVASSSTGVEVEEVDGEVELIWFDLYEGTN